MRRGDLESVIMKINVEGERKNEEVMDRWKYRIEKDMKIV